MKNPNKRITLKRKFILYGFRTFAPVFLMVAIFFVVLSSTSKIFELNKNSISNVRSISLSIKLIQDEIKKISTYISIDSGIKKILNAQNPDLISKNPRFWFEQSPMETLQNYVALNGDIKSFAIYPENGVKPFLRGMDGSTNHARIETIRETKEYSFTNQKPQFIYWCPVKNNTRGTYETNRKDKIVFYRELYDLKENKKLCFIAIGIDTETFVNVCQNSFQNDNDKYIIYNSQGEVLCDVGGNRDDLKIYIPQEILKRFDDKTDLVSFHYKNFFVTCCKLDRYGSIVCKVVPSSTFWGIIINSFITFIFILIVTMITLYVVLGIMSKYTTKPMLELSSVIKKFAEGDFTQRIEVSYNDEIGDVAKAFNKMVGDIDNLIKENYIIKMKEKETELASLQAQINPHFLYNTLNSMYWQAMDAENEDLAEKILSLSRLFQLVLSRGKQEILVENEFELIGYYLQIQKMRFADKLRYAINLEDSIKKEKFSKLLLQPFVENSIEHGFSNKTSECNLSISGRKRGNKMVFEIQDSGVGMTEQEISELLEGKERHHKDRVGGYAIKNIVDRIKLLYGEEGSFEIRSKIGEGTLVVITVPLGGK